MDFFKSVFSEPTPSPSPPSTPNSPITQPVPQSSPWAFGSTIFSAIASKSESLLDNYYKDIQEFSSGLKKETSVIRQAATRAVKELPCRLESGAAIAQESLEAVGQAIDNVGSSLADIIGNDLSFSANLNEIGENDGDRVNYGKDSGFSEIVKPYSRIDSLIRSLQCSVKTYCEEVEEIDYCEWEVGFRMEDKGEEIELLVEENGVIKDIYDEIVPRKVDAETFWCRYFYKVDKVIKAEEARARFVKRAIAGEEELSWDIDDEGEDNGGDRLLKEDDARESSDELENEIEGNDKKVVNLRVKSMEKGVGRVREDETGVSGTKGEQSTGEESVDERLKCDDKEGSEGKIESDFSVVSSQRFDEDDIGWDEIEAFGSGDENKVVDHGSSSFSSTTDLHKRLSGANQEEEEEELTWDIEDEDPVKS